MKVWVDGDACPKAIREIVFKAAINRKVHTVFVSNSPAIIPASPFVRQIQVSKGFDKADRYIVDNLEPGHLVITADIPLSDGVISKGAIALNPRGTLYTASNVKQVLASRNLNEMLRESGQITGGSAPLSAKEVQTFSRHFDATLTKGLMKGSV